jgi:hypothetical protein
MDEKIKVGKITEKEALEKLCGQCLIGFKNIGSEKSISRRRKVQALCRDLEIKNFILSKGYEMLDRVVNHAEKFCILAEKWLLASGRLKS